LRWFFWAGEGRREKSEERREEEEVQLGGARESES